MHTIKSFLNNISVGKKITLGTGVILVLLAVITTVTYLGLSNTSSSFKTYRQHARETNQFGRIQANILLGRLGAKDYILKNTEEAAAIVNKRIAATATLIDEAAELIADEKNKTVVKSSIEEIDAYQMAFNEVTVLVGQRNELVNQLNTVGPGIERNMTKIMKGAYAAGNYQGAQSAGLGLRHIMLARLYANKFLVDNQKASSDRVLSEIAEFEKLSDQLFGQLSRNANIQLTRTVIADEKIYKTAFNDVVNVINTRNNIISSRMDVIGPKIANQMEELKLANKGLQDELGPRATAEVDEALLTTEIVAAFAFIIGGLIAFFTSRAISRPVVEMTSAMTELSDGNLEIEIPAMGRADEIGKMANAVSRFKEAAIQKIELESQSKEQAKLSESERASRQAEDARQTENIKFAVQTMAEGLEQFANGDLSVSVDQKFEGELDELRLNFNNSVAKINEAMVKISSITGFINDKSIEMRESADNLSKRTEGQAASLEETSAALEEITATVTETSNQSRGAADIADKAKTDTDKSSEIVSTAVEAMERIETASSEISKIINVIDEIAFQTNLLALNAGVEAARAGDAGSGFAVVAQEVRELAQRSANAAKEISGLITRSSTEVTTGVQLVRETGESLNKIAERVSEMNTKMATISKATDEQLAGVREVNVAVSDMDTMTQQNAAMAEESTAATFELATEAKSLSEMVGQFRLNYEENYAAQAA